MTYSCSKLIETTYKLLCLDLPTAFNITIDTKDHSVKLKIECNKVYPLPTCSVNIGVSNIRKTEY